MAGLSDKFAGSVSTALVGAAAGFGVGAACGYLLRNDGNTKNDKDRAEIPPGGLLDTSSLALGGTIGAQSAATTLRIAASMDLKTSAVELLRLATSEAGAVSAQIYVVDDASKLIFRGWGQTSKEFGGMPLLTRDDEQQEPWSVATDATSLVGQCAIMKTIASAPSSDPRSMADLPGDDSTAAAPSDPQATARRAALPEGGWIVCVPVLGSTESAISLVGIGHGTSGDGSVGRGSFHQRVPREDVIATIRIAFEEEPSQGQLQAAQAVATEAGPVLSRQRDLMEAEMAQSRLSLVLQMMRKVAAAANHAAVVETIVQAAYQLLAPQRVTVFIVDHTRGKLIISRSEDVAGAEIPIERGIAGSVATTGQVARVPDAYQDARFNSRVDAESGFRTRAVLCVPVRNSHGKVVAVIQVINRREYGGMLGQVLVPGLSRAKLAHHEEQEEDFVPASQVGKAGVSHQMGGCIAEVDEGDEGSDSGSADGEDGDEEGALRVASGDDLMQSGDSALKVSSTGRDGRAAGGKSRSAVPFGAAGRGTAIGTDTVVPHGGWAFTAADEVVMQALSSQAGLELDKSAAMEEMQRAQDATTAMHEIVQATALEPSVKGFIHRVMVATYRLLRCERVTLFLVDAAREELVLAYSNDAKGVRIPMRSGLAGHAAMTGKVVNVENAYRDKRFDRSVDKATGFVTRSVLCIPVQLPSTVASDSPRGDFSIDGEVQSREGLPIAVLQAINKDDMRPFDKLDEDAMKVFSLQVALALKRRTVEAAMLTMLSHSAGKATQDTTSPASGAGAGGGSKGRPSLRIDVAKAQASGSRLSELRTPTGAASPSQLISEMDSHERETALSLLNMYSDDRRRSELRQQAVFGGVMSAVKAAKLLRTKSWTKSVDMQASGMDSSDELLQWNWDVFEAYQQPDGENVLKQCVVRMMARFNVVSMFKVDETRLRRFVDRIRETYHNNPFHNWHHAIAVLQANFAILCKTQAFNFLRHADVFGLLVAALCHDADHPGHTNDYECNSGGDLAITYCDMSPLEHHHAAVTARVLARPESNIMTNMSSEVFAETRKLMCRAILSTDMQQHFAQVQQLGRRAADMAQKIAAASLSAQPSPASGSDGGADPLAHLPPLAHRSSSQEVSLTADNSPTISPGRQSFGGLSRPRSGSPPRSPTRSQGTERVSYTIRSRSASMANVLAMTPGGQSRSGRGTRRSASAPHHQPFDRTKEEDRLELAGIIVHLGDLSGQLYPKHLAVRWGNMVSQEFRAQVEQEEKRGMPSSPVMKGLETELGVYKSQCGFIQFVLMPLWQNALEVLPGLREPVQQLKTNLMFYQTESARIAAAGGQSRPAQFIPATAAYDLESPATQLREKSGGSIRSEGGGGRAAASGGGGGGN